MVDEVQGALGLFVIASRGQRNCFPLFALANATGGRVVVAPVRAQARQFVTANPAAPSVRALTQLERQNIDQDREYLSDAQARVVSAALRIDHSFSTRRTGVCDTPSTVRTTCILKRTLAHKCC